MTTTTPGAAPAAVDLSHTPDPGGIAPASVTETPSDAATPAARHAEQDAPPPTLYLSQSGEPNTTERSDVMPLEPDQVSLIRQYLGNPEFPESDITPGLLADMAITAEHNMGQALSRAETAESELAETKLELSRTIALSRDGGAARIDPALLSESASIASEKLDVALSKGMRREAVVMLKTDLLNGDRPNTLLLSRQPELGNVRVLDYLLKFAEVAGCYTSPLANPAAKTGMQALSRTIPDADGHSPEKEVPKPLPFVHMAERHNSQIKEPSRS